MDTISTREAAKKLNVSPRRVRQLFRAGVLRGQLVGARFILIDRESLPDAEKRCQVPGRKRKSA